MLFRSAHEPVGDLRFEGQDGQGVPEQVVDVAADLLALRRGGEFSLLDLTPLLDIGPDPAQCDGGGGEGAAGGQPCEVRPRGEEREDDDGEQAQAPGEGQAHAQCRRVQDDRAEIWQVEDIRV